MDAGFRRIPGLYTPVGKVGAVRCADPETTAKHNNQARRGRMRRAAASKDAHRNHAMSYEIRSILYASDLTPRSPAVFRHAVGLARKFGARLHAVTVSLPASNLPYTEFITEQTLDDIKLAGHKRAEAQLRERIAVFAETYPEFDVDSVLASVRALEGDPARRILDLAKHVLADIIVMGSRGQGALEQFMIGSVAHKVTMKADVPVVLVPIDR